jgi:hypothetical protein
MEMALRMVFRSSSVASWLRLKWVVEVVLLVLMRMVVLSWWMMGCADWAGQSWRMSSLAGMVLLRKESSRSGPDILVVLGRVTRRGLV